jgi:hypothetical protein
VVPAAVDVSVISGVWPPIRHGDAAAQRLIARVGPSIAHWGMSRPLAPLSPGSGVFLFCVGSVVRRCRGAVCE